MENNQNDSLNERGAVSGAEEVKSSGGPGAAFDGFNGGTGGAGFGDNGVSGVSKEKGGNKKVFIIAGVAIVAVVAVITTAILLINNNKTSGGVATVTPEISEKELDEGEPFSLAEYGLLDNATPEEVEAKMIELGLFDPNETYENDPDADIESEDYCGDDTCKEVGEIQERKFSEVSVDTATVFKGYTERAGNFIQTLAKVYFTTAYPNSGAVSISKGEDISTFSVQLKDGKKFSIKVMTSGEDGSIEVSKAGIYNSEGKEVFSSTSKYFEY